MFNDKGQTLMELLVVIAVSVIIIGALVFATISSLRNAQFSKNQAQATKLAQEGIEKLRSIRDRNSSITTSIRYPLSTPPRNIDKFSDTYSVYLSRDHCNGTNGICYFRFLSGVLTQEATKETIGNFSRQILLSDDANYQNIKKASAVVTWSDFAGPHQSVLTTILRKL